MVITSFVIFCGRLTEMPVKLLSIKLTHIYNTALIFSAYQSFLITVV
jgi:hypothetical protein